MLILLSGEQAALPEAALTDISSSGAASQKIGDFAEVLGDAFADLANSDAELVSDEPLPAWGAVPVPLLGGFTNEPLATHNQASGSRSPLSGNSFPSYRQFPPQDFSLIALGTDAEQFSDTSAGMPSTVNQATTTALGDAANGLETMPGLNGMRTYDGKDMLLAERLAAGKGATAIAMTTQNDASLTQSERQNYFAGSLEEMLDFGTAMTHANAKSIEREGISQQAPAISISSAGHDLNIQPQTYTSALSAVSNLGHSESSKTVLLIPQAPNHPGWADTFAERVAFVVKQNFQEAELRLNPPQLGQIEVRIALNNDQANLLFTSPHGAVRDAIESSIVRLRDMLAESGITLGNVDVSDKSLAQDRRGSFGRNEFSQNSSSSNYSSEFDIAENGTALLRPLGNNRIDYFV